METTMAAATHRTKTITIGPDGIATRRRRVEGSPEAPEIVEHINAVELFPEHGRDALVPDGSRFYVADDGATAFVIETPPESRCVHWCTEGFSELAGRLIERDAHRLWGLSRDAFVEQLERQTSFVLAFPFLLHVCTFIGDTLTAVQLFYRRTPLQMSFDELSLPNVPHIDPESCALCTPDGLPITAQRAYGETFGATAERAMRTYWNATWGTDHCERFLEDAARIDAVSSPWEWERQSSIDAFTMRRLPWRASDVTVDRCIRRRVYALTRDPVTLIEQRFDAALARGNEAPREDQHEDRQDLCRSTEEQITLFSGQLYVGDRVHIKPGCFEEHPGGGVFTIEWFCRPVSQFRRVKLVDTETPISLIYQQKFRDGASIDGVTSEARVTLDGVELREGTTLRFTGGPLLELFGPSGYLHTAWRRGQNVVMAKISTSRHEARKVVIGSGMSFLPGISMLEQQEVDCEGFLVAQEVVLSDGTVVRVGDRFLMAAWGSVEKVVVRRFYPTKPSRAVRSMQWDFQATGGQRYTLAVGAHLQPKIIPLPAKPLTTITVGERTISVGDMVEFDHHRAPIKELTPLFPNGIVYALFERTGWFTLMENEKPAQNVRFLPTCQVEEDGSA
ncbi:MAG: hypothetical protein ABIG71_00595, partial [Candidatus Uhrbacteria bacterium]